MEAMRVTEDQAVTLCGVIRDAVAPDCWGVTLSCYSEEHVDPDERTLGDCTWQWPARTARIRVALREHSDSEVASTLLHELLHLATAGMQAVHDRARERLSGEAGEVQWAAWLDEAERHVRALEIAMQPQIPAWLEAAGLAA